MYNENTKGIGIYFIYSVIFHIILIGLIVYLSVRYIPEIQSIGSNVVVSVVNRVPGPPASVRRIIYPHRHKITRHIRVVHKVFRVKVRRAVSGKKHVSVKVKQTKRLHSMPTEVVAPAPIPIVSSGAYTRLKNRVSLNNIYSRMQESLIRGNIHKFQGYVNKIASTIISNFNISLVKYLHYKSIVAFQISESGRIFGVRLVKSSGSGYFDAQSIEAVKLSSPLPPPPDGFMKYVNSKNAGEGALIRFNPKEILKMR